MRSPRSRFVGLCLVCTALAAPSIANAGLAGWLTSRTRSWQFVQESGGIRINEPVRKDGIQVLPVEFDPTGETGVTRRPVRLDSGLAVRKVTAAASGANRIVIQVVTQLTESDAATGRVHYAELESFPAGEYRVYYESPGSTRFLGTIRVK